MPALVSVSNLGVRYGAVQALAPVSLELPEGVWALLGPNGAGKSTLIRTLLGLTHPSSGRARVLGHDSHKDPGAVRSQVGYMPESPALLPGLSGVQYVTLAARLSGMDANEARRQAHVALDEVGIGESRYRGVEGYSMGMRQRVKMAQAIAHNPKLLILDEPTNGLDPAGREAMLDFINVLTKRGVSLLFSSHILPEVRQVCSQAVILRAGKVLHQGPLEALQKDTGGLRVETLQAPDPLIKELTGLGYEVTPIPSGLIVEGTANLNEIMKHAANTGIALRSARPNQRAVQDLVVDLMEAEV